MTELPRYLYRYRSLAGDAANWTREIFENNELYCPTIAQCDDPFEGCYILSFEASDEVKVDKYTQILQRRKALSASDARLRAETTIRSGASEFLPEKRREHVREVILKRTPLLSLSVRNDDIRLWAHYAGGHRGICIEFELKEDPEFFQEVRPVCYQDELPCLNFWVDSTQVMAEKACLRKASRWKDQQEWRIVDMVNGPQEKAFSPRAISGLIMGCWISDTNRANVLQWIKGRPRPVTLYEARTRADSYGLDIVPVADS